MPAQPFNIHTPELAHCFLLLLVPGNQWRSAV